MHKKLSTIFSIAYIAVFVCLWIGVPLQITMNSVFSAPTTFAQEDLICPANSHQVGSECICDSYYKSVGDSCVPMTEAEMCPTPNSHRVGNECVCDSFYKPSGGQCVPMEESEMCPVPNTHRVGNDCVCNAGYLAAGGKCVDPYAYCAAHNATYSPSIEDCTCIEGYIENSSKSDCIKVIVDDTKSPPPTPSSSSSSPSPSPTPPTRSTVTPTSSTSSPSPTATAPAQSIVPPTTPSPPTSTGTDPVKMMLELQSTSPIEINNTPILDASLKSLTPTEISFVEDQKEVIQSMISTGDTVELLPTEEEKMNLVRNAVVLEAAKKWNQAVKETEKTEKLKDENARKEFIVLKQEEASLVEQITSNQTALTVMHKQNIQIIFSQDQAAAALFANDTAFENFPKRDFLKESNGDHTEAMVRATDAIARQYEFIRNIKKELKRVREEKRELLDIPPQPDVDQELSKLKINWYKK